MNISRFVLLAVYLGILACAAWYVGPLVGDDVSPLPEVEIPYCF